MNTNKRTYGYARVSSKEQNLARQIDALTKFGVEERDIITDKTSGKNFDRPGYLTLKTKMLRSGDTLIIKSLDRLGRNKRQTKDELKYFQQMGVRVKILDIPTTLTEFDEKSAWVLDMVNNILIEVLGTIAEHERNTIRERQVEGIASARKKGKHLGRPKIAYPENWQEYYTKWKSGEITASKAMKEMNLSRTTFYRLAKEYNSSMYKYIGKIEQ